MDHPFVPGVIAGLAGTAFVLARWSVAAHFRIAAFIQAGAGHLVNPARLAMAVPVFPGTGYDGQYYFRLALDPANLVRTAFGIQLDTLARLGRIGYPALSWLFAAGQAGAVPLTLVVVNVVSLAALGFAGGLIARDSSHHALWGLAVAGYWGLLWSVGRDLTEVTAAAFCVFGLCALRRGWPALAGLSLMAGVLCSETAMIAPIAIFVGWLVQPGAGSGLRRWVRRPGILAWVLPVVGFGVWQLVVLVVSGALPALHSGRSNLAAPFYGMSTGISHYLVRLPSPKPVLWVGEFTVLAAVTVAAACSFRRSAAPLPDRLAWAEAALVAVFASASIWMGIVGFRSLDLVFVLGWVLLLGIPKNWWLRWLAAATGVSWVVVFIQLVLLI